MYFGKMRHIEAPNRHINSAWKVFQVLIFISFLVANIELNWGIEGIAAPVMGGMLAYYSTGVLLGLIAGARKVAGLVGLR